MKTPRIFEVGFGTGLNTMLTLIEARRKGISCLYHTIEAFPLEQELIDQLNYKAWIQPEFHSVFDLLHTCGWDQENQITEQFTFRKIHEQLQQFIPGTQYDLVYFDAFAPDKQPEMWTEDIFRMISASMSEQGIIVTYSAKGEIRRILERVGFAVEKLNGPPGKKHMLRGIKQAHFA